MRLAAKAILVPTAERDGALGLGIFPPVFRGVRALMYNSFEERALIQGVSNNQSVPGVVVGVGSEIPERSNGGRFRQKFNMRDRFAIYVGRIDENKGCVELFEFFEAAQDLGAAILVHPWDMMGTDTMPKYWLPWLVGMPAETALVTQRRDAHHGALHPRLRRCHPLRRHHRRSGDLREAVHVRDSADLRRENCRIARRLRP
mgnify:CR=1 FL=1